MKLKAALIAGIALFAAGSLQAVTTVYVHGFHFSVQKTETAKNCQGATTCPTYWGQQDNSTPVVFVGYDGRFNPIAFNADRGVPRMLAILNQYCRRDQGKSCRIVNHSMGGLVTGYTLANYNRTGTYNILYVSSLVSAEAGSELANIGSPILSAINVLTLGLADYFLNFPDAVRALQTSAARGAYDHNQNNGTPFYHIAGNTPFPWYLSFAELVFPGSHDTVVAMHTTCSYRTIEKYTQCGGQSITTGALWWKKTTNYVTHTGHYAHPLHSRTGVGVKHLEFPNQANMVKSGL
ncbi:MAG: hypothetical protein K8S54_01855 [Spirochaetia bacterium]|nr:hypothetical protein [Spirochaetia bacterium]